MSDNAMNPKERPLVVLGKSSKQLAPDGRTPAAHEIPAGNGGKSSRAAVLNVAAAVSLHNVKHEALALLIQASVQKAERRQAIVDAHVVQKGHYAGKFRRRRTRASY